MKKPRQNKVIIGVTGNFGSGKTTVSRMLASSAVKIIDADRITHDIMRPGTVVYRKIIRAFGASISIRGKAVNRQALGRQIGRAHV